MKEIQLTIKALSPLAIGRQKPGGSVSEAQTYISGSVIRGAIASQILSQSPGHDESPGGDFQTLFLGDGAAVFTNAYPTAEGRRVEVLPATAVSSKTDSGFLSEDSDNGGVFDTLIDRFCAEGYGHIYDPSCPKDGGRVEPYGGFYSVQGKTYQSHSVDTRLLTRVGINRRRAVAQENVLYSLEVINESGPKGEDVIFSGSVYLKDEVLAQTLVEYLNGQDWRLGGSTSRGLGKVKIQARVQDYASDVANRVEDFNAALKDRWGTWSLFGAPQADSPKNRQFFTLNLQSDTILTEQWCRTMVISPEMLRQMTTVNDSDLKLHAPYSSYDYRSGWNAAWGLMKDVELITNRGSVYLFSTKNLEIWLPALEKLEVRGIGDRTSEGFGQVQICSPFHQIFRENAV